MGFYREFAGTHHHACSLVQYFGVSRIVVRRDASGVHPHEIRLGEREISPSTGSHIPRQQAGANSASTKSRGTHFSRAYERRKELRGNR